MCIRDRSIYTVENFTSDITVEGYIAEFRDELPFLELCKQCTNYGKSWGCPPFDFEDVYKRQMLETINLPEIETVNGSIIMEANMEAPPTGSFVPRCV